MSEIRVSALSIYPVKSLRGINVERLEFDALGPRDDRRWMVIDERGRFLTQRQLPTMCLISTAFEQGQLTLRHTTQAPIIAPRGGGEILSATVWRDTVQVEDCGDEIAAWLSHVLARPCRLVFMPQNRARTVSHSESNLGFADAYPLLLTSTASLASFNAHLNFPITMARFRPNMVVDAGAAYAEDNWERISINQQEFTIASPCTRCAVPAINPDTAQRQTEVIDALNRFRRFGNETRFGVNVIPVNAKAITLGDTVKVQPL